MHFLTAPQLTPFLIFTQFSPFLRNPASPPPPSNYSTTQKSATDQILTRKSRQLARTSVLIYSNRWRALYTSLRLAFRDNTRFDELLTY